MTDSTAQATPGSSIWNIPGLDKDTFYAAALYLHASKGQLEGKPLARAPKTPQATRDFLDRLADCFARSKLQDARDHVSATAMVRNDEQKEITLYIAKNQSNKECKPSISHEEQSAIVNENEQFAGTLMTWFSELASEDTAEADNDVTDRYLDVFEAMCMFSQSRLEHYIEKIGACDIEDLEPVVLLNVGAKFTDGWNATKPLIDECSRYQEAKTNLTNFVEQMPCLLRTYTLLAGQVRKNPDFQELADKIEILGSDMATKLRGVAQTVKWVNYLGRLWAAYVNFLVFCRHEEQSGYTFKHELLPSQEDKWSGDAYLQKIRSWVGNLDLQRDTRKFVNGRTVIARDSVETVMGDVIKRSGNRARVHCEMLLMMHFSQPGVEKCLDYFGCSKKSCWLCWQMILQNKQRSMKDTHRKLFPLWAFPFDFSTAQSAVAEGLRAAHNEMLSLIQDMVIKQIPLSDLEPYPQTSARITPTHRRASIGDTSGIDAESGLFSGNPLIGPDSARMPIIVVPALHLPAHDSSGDVRRVKIWGYNRDESSFDERLFISDPILKGKVISLAFQLLALHDYDKLLGFKEARKRHSWDTVRFPNFKTRAHTYTLYYRSANTLAPNPCLLSIWRTIEDEDFAFFPYRGDAFIIKQKYQDPSRGELEGGLRPELMGESSHIDDLECLQDLKSHWEVLSRLPQRGH
ncbi:uncharacterized protein BDZ99DRAFT_522953 [Mytilinidion resinicola]|uniref:Uncharacterized protein n=1 Tax=Mytilinidion resinicola TaxID=574789 RepID=A0A6A6YFI8_9PEZI|nr:uncharacterized protein BDZ99DRAFT_522953 [Mytilinidion resinicola]KAF2807338.1 hypothetical protein BDZ99DRAFT_522953 [Mytilinidion resinicola]